MITGGTGSFGNAVLHRFLHTDHFREIHIRSILLILLLMTDPKPDMNKVKALLKGVVWDYNISEDELLEIFLHEKEGQSLNANQLKARLLNTYNWYFLLDFFGRDFAKRFLDDKITVYLFPATLKDKYVRAGRILYS